MTEQETLKAEMKAELKMELEEWWESIDFSIIVDRVYDSLYYDEDDNDEYYDMLINLIGEVVVEFWKENNLPTK